MRLKEQGIASLRKTLVVVGIGPSTLASRRPGFSAWGCGGASGVLGDPGNSLPLPSFPSSRLALPQGLPASPGGIPARSVQAGDGGLGLEGSGSHSWGAVWEPVRALFTTSHFLPLSDFSNCCCFCFLSSLLSLSVCLSLSLSPASCDSLCLPRLSWSASPSPSPHHAPRPLPSLEAQGLGLGGLPAWARGPEWKTVVQTAPRAPTVPQGLSRVSWGLKPPPGPNPKSRPGNAMPPPLTGEAGAMLPAECWPDTGW